MVARTIEWCNENRFLVFVVLIITILGGIWSSRKIPLDALPDISDVQVIIHTRWPGAPPDVIENQVTYPIVSTLLSAPQVKAVRAETMFNDSHVFVIFQDGTDIYWARSRVLEYLQRLQGLLPTGVQPVIGPDATGAGWIYEYVLVDKTHKHSLEELTTLQDWFVRFQLETVPGVAEVATIGGFRRQYQVKLDSNRLLALGIPLQTVIDKIRDSTGEAGGRVLEMAGANYMIRSSGFIKTLDDLAYVPVGVHNGTPILVRDLGVVSFGPELRQGIAEWNGEGETVGGIVIMRYGQNALTVINRIKAKITELRKSLPPGVEILTAYDRSDLIQAAVNTLKYDLIYEAIIVSVVIVVFLAHFGSAFIPVLTIPLALIASLIPLYLFQVSLNIMSLGGFVLAIGVLVDASIVMVENAHRHLAEASRRGIPLSIHEHRQIVLEAAKQVGRPLFYSLLIIVLSFLPIFLLEAQEGRLFKPLAYTKTFAVIFASVLAITVVPIIMTSLIRARRYRSEADNVLVRFLQNYYLKVLRFCLRHRTGTLCAGLIFLVATCPLALGLGSQFMPPLFEGSILYMPEAIPGLSITLAGQLLQEQDRIIKSFPEVASVFGTAGRSDSATDNAPLEMYDTTVMLKPRHQWRPGMTYDRLVQEMDAKLRFPGLSNIWTMPVANRLDMELSGIKTPLGLKIQGPELGEIRRIGRQVEEILKGIPGTRNVFAERVNDGLYVTVTVRRAEAARYGITVGDVERIVASAMGGDTIADTIEGRARYSINVRYLADYRNRPEALRSMLIATPEGAQIPLGEVADVKVSRGPSMIRDEDAQLTAYVFLDLASADYGSYVARAQKALERKLNLPSGYTIKWAGEYEYQLRAKKRFYLIIPMVLAAILLTLHLLFRSIADALILIFPCAFALTGGLIVQYLLGFNFSVAAAVGYINLLGIAVETSVIMVMFMEEAVRSRIGRAPISAKDIEDAVIEGAVYRLRPKLMTVLVVILSLTPVFFESGIGNDVMRPIAAPVVGGMVTSFLAVLILLPVLYAATKERILNYRRLTQS